MQSLLNFLLALFKEFASIIKSIQKDDPIKVVRKGSEKTVIIPKSVIITFIVIAGMVLIETLK